MSGCGWSLRRSAGRSPTWSRRIWRERGALKVRERTRFEAEVKRELLTLVARTQARTGWTRRRILHRLGLSKARYGSWTKRAADGAPDALADRSTRAPGLDGILAEENTAVMDYALAHPKDGYGRLAWQMIDENVACLSPASV